MEKKEKIDIVTVLEQLHAAMVAVITPSFLLNTRYIDLDGLMALVGQHLSEETVELLKSDRLKAELYINMQTYIPRIVKPFGYTVEWSHSLGHLNSTVIFRPNIEGILDKLCRERYM